MREQQKPTKSTQRPDIKRQRQERRKEVNPSEITGVLILQKKQRQITVRGLKGVRQRNRKRSKTDMQ